MVARVTARSRSSADNGAVLGSRTTTEGVRRCAPYMLRTTKSRPLGNKPAHRRSRSAIPTHRLPIGAKSLSCRCQCTCMMRRTRRMNSGARELTPLRADGHDCPIIGGADLQTGVHRAGRPVRLRAECRRPRGEDSAGERRTLTEAVRVPPHPVSRFPSSRTVGGPSGARTGWAVRGSNRVGRTLHHANRPTVVRGGALPGHFTRPGTGAPEMPRRAVRDAPAERDDSDHDSIRGQSDLSG
jgi:hypothetical protein